MRDKKRFGFPTAAFTLSLALVTVLAPAGTDMYLASMPDIARHFSVSYASVQLTLTVYLFAQGAGQLFFGPITDRFGRRGPLLAGVAVFTAASIASGLSPSLAFLIASRLVQGLAGALMLVVALSSVRDVADGAAAARIFAVLLAIEGLAPIFAPVLGGYIDAFFGWEAVMFASAVMAAAAFANSAVNLGETLPVTERQPLQPGIIYKTYKRIATDKNFLLPCLGLSATFFFLFAYLGGGAYLFQTIHGLSPEGFGLVFGITGAAVMGGAVLSARLAERENTAAIGLKGLGLLIGGIVTALVFSTFGTGQALYGIIGGLCVAMFGFGMAETALVSLTMASQTTALGFTAALMGSIQLMLSSLATPISGWLIPFGATPWFTFLLVSACVPFALTLLAKKRMARRASPALQEA